MTTSIDPIKQPFFKTFWFWGALIGIVLVTGGIWINYSRLIQLQQDSIPQGEAIALPVAGHPAPDFTLKTLEGDALTLSEFRGKPVVINFWATWCGPCRQEFPDFQDAATDNADRLVVIGVNNTSTDQKENVGEFITEMGVTFPIVLDETGDVAKTYQIFGLPTTIFIDENGVVLEVFTGPVNKAYIESKINDL